MNLLKKIKEWFKGHNIWYYYQKEEMNAGYPIFRIRPFFAWYDFWMGLFIDQKKRQIYFFPLPMLGFQIGYQCPKIKKSCKKQND